MFPLQQHQQPLGVSCIVLSIHIESLAVVVVVGSFFCSISLTPFRKFTNASHLNNYTIILMRQIVSVFWMCAQTKQPHNRYVCPTSPAISISVRYFPNLWLHVPCNSHTQSEKLNTIVFTHRFRYISRGSTFIDFILTLSWTLIWVWHSAVKSMSIIKYNDGSVI